MVIHNTKYCDQEVHNLSAKVYSLTLTNDNRRGMLICATMLCLGIVLLSFLSNSSVYATRDNLLTTEATHKTLSVLGHIGGAVEAVAIVGNYALIGTGPDLVTLDISSHMSPTQVAVTALSGHIVDIHTTADLAYIAADGAGIIVVDISNPLSPREVGSVDTPGYAMAVFVEAEYAYVADTGGLQVVDISDPTRPILLGSVRDPNNDVVLNVVASGNYAYVAGQRSWSVIDLANKVSPHWRGPISGGQHSVISPDMTIAGGYLYRALGTAGLDIMSLSDPAIPRSVALFDTPGHVGGVEVAGTHAYVADANYGLRILRLSLPGRPTEVGFLPAPASEGNIKELLLSEGYVYFTSAFGLQAVDVSVPANPITVGNHTTPIPFGVSYLVENEYAFPARGWIVDISDPTNLILDGYLDLDGISVEKEGDLLYVGTDYQGMHIIDVANPQIPVPTSSYLPPELESTRIRALDISQNYAYLVTSRDTIEVVDVSNAYSPDRVSSYQLESAGDIAVVGNRAFVAANNELVSMDISNPTRLIEVDSLAMRGGRLVLVGNYAYVYTTAGVSGQPAGFWIVDLSDPNNMIPQDFHPTGPGSIRDIAISAEYAYVAVGGNLLYILDISSPLSPVEVGIYKAPTTAPNVVQSVEAEGEIVYVSGHYGFFSLLLTDHFSNHLPLIRR